MTNQYKIYVQIFGLNHNTVKCYISIARQEIYNVFQNPPAASWNFKQIYEAQKKSCYKQFSSMHNRTNDSCFYFYVNEDIKRNCRGEGVRPPHIAKDDFCEYLDFDDPFLRLGPFHLENLNQEPTIAQIHNFMYTVEMDELKVRNHFYFKWDEIYYTQYK